MNRAGSRPLPDFNMSIPRDGNIPVAPTCDNVKRGTVLRLFDANCSIKLKTFTEDVVLTGFGPKPSTSPERRKCVRAAKKSSYMELEALHQVVICDPPTQPFARKGRVIRMKVTQPSKCPFNIQPFRYRLQVQYSEATNPNNGISSNIVTIEDVWPPDEISVQKTISTPTIGDPFDRQSSGTGTCTIQLYLIDNDPTNSCAVTNIGAHATLNNMGLDPEVYYGSPTEQWREAACPSFSDGRTTVGGFWTTANFGGRSVGLVSSMNWFATGINE